MGTVNHDGRVIDHPVVREAALTAVVGVIVILFCISLLSFERGFFWYDDYQIQYLAGFRDVARSWSHGEFPLLSPSSWRGGALAAEYQFGVFSVFETACVLLVFGSGLPLPLAAAALSTIHVVVLAAGAFRLARRRGLTADLAMMVALVGSLSGWITIWGATNWFPALASFAWVPWVWWALERAGEERQAWTWFVPTGLFIYLVIAAGWPFSVLMTVVITLWWMARRWHESRHCLGVWPAVAAWAVGLGLSSPAWLILAEFTRHSMRGRTPSVLIHNWAVPIDAWFALVSPTQITLWMNFGGQWVPHMSIELAAGLVPVAVLAAVLCATGWNSLRAFPWEWGLCGVTLLLAMLPGTGNFRWSFRWLPLFFLSFGLLAAHSFALLRAGSTAPLGHDPVRALADTPKRVAASNPGNWAVGLLLLAWVHAWISVFDLSAVAMIVCSSLAILCFFWARTEGSHTASPWLRCFTPLVIVVMSCWLPYAGHAPFREVQGWRFDEKIRESGPLEPAVRYSSLYLHSDLFGAPRQWGQRPPGGGESLRPGNCAMYAGLDFISGYSALQPRGLEELMGFHVPQGCTTEDGAKRVLVTESGPTGLLRLFGVDGLIVTNCLAIFEPRLRANGWKPVATVEGGKVFRRDGPPSPRVRALEEAEFRSSRAEVLRRLLDHRSGPVPLLLTSEDTPCREGVFNFSPARLKVVHDRRNWIEVEVTRLSNGGEILVAFSRPWYPGYRALFNGRELPVLQLDLTMPAVRVPAGADGRLVLEYRPRSLVLGYILAAATGTAVLLTLLGSRCMKGRSSTFATGRSMSPPCSGSAP